MRKRPKPKPKPKPKGYRTKPATERKDVSFRMRMTAEEHEWLNRLATFHGLSASAMVRMLFRRAYVAERHWKRGEAAALWAPPVDIEAGNRQPLNATGGDA